MSSLVCLLQWIGGRTGGILEETRNMKGVVDIELRDKSPGTKSNFQDTPVSGVDMVTVRT